VDPFVLAAEMQHIKDVVEYSDGMLPALRERAGDA
jgi:hypothetical protein